MPDNMDRFNENVGRVFEQLYNTFPVRQTIDVAKMLGLEIAVEKGRSMATPEQIELCEEASYAILWLIDEGFLYGTASGRFRWTIRECQLTSKGLALMDATPSSVDKAKTTGEVAVEHLKNGMFVEAGKTITSAINMTVMAGIQAAASTGLS